MSKNTLLFYSALLLTGLSILTYGFVRGPISLNSLIEVINGDKPFAKLHEYSIQTKYIKGPTIDIDDNNVYMSSLRYSADLHNIIHAAEYSFNPLQINNIITELLTMYPELSSVENDGSLNSLSSVIFHLFGFELAKKIEFSSTQLVETIVFQVMKDMDRTEATLFLQKNNLYSKEGKRRVQSDSVIFEYTAEQKLSRIVSR